jgi:hypothetical protein
VAQAEPQLLRHAAKLATAVFITAALAMHFERIRFIWYPLLAVLIVVDDNDANTLKAASGRIFGTVVGGLITFLVHTVLSGPAGVMVSLLLMVPVLRALGWQSSLGTAALVSLMFLMIPSHEALNWDYVFNRALDTAVGCVVAVLVGLLFWPRTGLMDLQGQEHALLVLLQQQLLHHQQWLRGLGPRPEPVAPALISRRLLQMRALVNQERQGPRQKRLRAQRWPLRIVLWDEGLHHWMQWERQLLALPIGSAGSAPLCAALAGLTAALGPQAPPALPPPAPRPAPLPAALPVPIQRWAALARDEALPLLALLALAEEQAPLQRILTSLVRLRGAER